MVCFPKIRLQPGSGYIRATVKLWLPLIYHIDPLTIDSITTNASYVVT